MQCAEPRPLHNCSCCKPRSHICCNPTTLQPACRGNPAQPSLLAVLLRCAEHCPTHPANIRQPASPTQHPPLDHLCRPEGAVELALRVAVLPPLFACRQGVEQASETCQQADKSRSSLGPVRGAVVLTALLASSKRRSTSYRQHQMEGSVLQAGSSAAQACATAVSRPASKPHLTPPRRAARLRRDRRRCSPTPAGVTCWRLQGHEGWQ